MISNRQHDGANRFWLPFLGAVIKRVLFLGMVEKSTSGAAPTPTRAPKVLAIASGGGHWLELCRLMPAFVGLDVAFVSVHRNYADQVPGRRFYTMRDISRLNPWGGFILLPQLLHIVLRERPSVIITTGSAPALLAIGLAKLLLRSRTIWIDSIANVDSLSTSGKLARHVTDTWLTQWPGLQGPRGPDYWGEVI